MEVGGYSRQSFARRSSFNTGLQNGHKDGTSLRSRRTRTRWITSLGHREAVFLKAFGKHGAQKFSERYWIQLIQEGSSEKRVEYCVDHKNSLCYLRAIQGHFGGIPIVPELMGYTSIPYNWKEHIFHRGCSWSVQPILGSGLIPDGKESDTARQAVFFTPLNPFGENPDKEEHHDDCTVPQKVHYHSHWKRNHDAVCWIKLYKAQDLGVQFWQTKSFAIITHNPLLGDCIFRVISEKRDRVLFERLSNPGQHPKLR